MYIGIIIFVALAFYVRTIRYSIIVDDIRRYKQFEKGFGKFPWTNPRQMVTQIFNMFYGAGTFGRNTYIDHTLTVCMHALVCVLVYLAFGSSFISFCTALIYCVHPMNSQVSVWLNGRRYQVCVIFILLMLIFKPWGIIFYFPMLVFQMTGIFAPILYMDAGWWVLALVPMLVYLNRKKIDGALDSRYASIFCKDHRNFSWKRLYIIPKCYGFYFFNMIYPERSMMNYKSLYEWGLTQKGNKDAYSFNMEFWRGILAFALTGLGFWYFKGFNFYMWAFMVVATMQWSGIIGAFQMLTDRYVSVAIVFMQYFICLLAFTFLGHYALVFLAFMFGSHIANLNITLRMYYHIDSFFDYQLFFRPEMAKHRSFRANYYLKHNKIAQAWSLIEIGLWYDSKHFMLLYDAAVCSRMAGNMKQAEHFISEAEKYFFIDQEKNQSAQIKLLRDQLVKDREYIIKKQAEYKQKVKTEGEPAPFYKGRKKNRKKRR